MRRKNRRKKLLVDLIILAVILLILYSYGLSIPTEALAGDCLNAGKPPSLEHPFGTDSLGRDLLVRTIKGMSVSMTVGAVASVVSAVIAVFIGMGATRGWKSLDRMISWLIDLVMSVPHTILIILISFVMGRGLKGLLIGICATHWCALARLIRGKVLQLRTKQYVAVSRRLGKSGGWILVHHLLPHLMPQFMVGLILLFPHAILHEASISFLGFGLSPEKPAIGIILSESMRYLSVGMWWPAVLPGLTLVFVVLLVDKVGENLRLLMDPCTAQE